MKVLIISHNAISTTNNMGKTLQSLFSEFNKEELCQLFIHPMLPDIDICSSYYCISDEEVLHSMFFGKKPGHVLDKESVFEQQKNVKNFSSDTYENARKNNTSSMKRLLRDFMWKLSKWDNQYLEQWLKTEKPTCIFLAPGYAKFIYDIALAISEKLNIPIITYICDDYYFLKEPKRFLDKLQLKLLQKKTDELFQKTVHLIAICEEIKTTYVNKFGTEATVIMTGSDFEVENDIKIKSNPTSLSYFGNIRCNRNISLAEVGRALDEINQQEHTEYKLKIYTSEKDSNILSVLDGIESVQMCEFVIGDEFRKAFKSADVLLHVEAFDEESMDLVKNSISTKIADCLGSGIPFVAYGPEGVASIKHLLRCECALIATKREDLKKSILVALKDREKIVRVVEKANKTAIKYHGKKQQSLKLKKILNEVECFE